MASFMPTTTGPHIIRAIFNGHEVSGMHTSRSCLGSYNDTAVFLILFLLTLIKTTILRLNWHRWHRYLMHLARGSCWVSLFLEETWHFIFYRKPVESGYSKSRSCYHKCWRPWHGSGWKTDVLWNIDITNWWQSWCQYFVYVYLPFLFISISLRMAFGNEAFCLFVEFFLRSNTKFLERIILIFFSVLN